MKLVIFLGGERGSGKSTSAMFLAGQLEKKGIFTATMNYADTIYAVHDEIERKFSHAVGRAPLKKNRALLQKLGTEIGRELYHPDIWVMLTKARIEQFFDGTEMDACVIVADVRFENELLLSETLKDQGYRTISIYLDAPEKERLSRVEGTAGIAGHESEALLQTFKNKFDYTIDTSMTVDVRDESLVAILRGNDLVPSPEDILSEIIAIVNAELRDWSSKTGYGANFDWRYESDGSKVLSIRDCSPVETLPKDSVAQALSETAATLAAAALVGPVVAETLDGK